LEKRVVRLGDSTAWLFSEKLLRSNDDPGEFVSFRLEGSTSDWRDQQSIDAYRSVKLMKK
jgi:hypothetical protein